MAQICERIPTQAWKTCAWQSGGAGPRRSWKKSEPGSVEAVVFTGLLKFRADFTISGLNTVLFHGQRPIHAMKLEIEPTSVANRIAVAIPSPQRGLVGSAISATGSSASSGTLENK